MKNLYQITFIFLVFCSSITAQELTEKQKEYEKNKVQMFTVEERDNLQGWLQEEFSQMNLSEEKQEEYTTVLLSYVGKIQRLDDKDSGNSKEEVIEKIDKLMAKQDKDLQKILSPEEFAMHTKIYDRLLLSVKNRITDTQYE